MSSILLSMDLHTSDSQHHNHLMKQQVEKKTKYRYGSGYQCLKVVKQGIKILISVMILFYSETGFGQADFSIDNPVLPRVRDVGVLKFNGAYYLGGMGTEGGFFVSEDLVHWNGPMHVLSMDNDWTSGESAENHNIHAGDINYINGTFHYYWSVNYWGSPVPNVHIGHATASHILGPYTEPEKNSWLDNRIDAELFIDDDGQSYLYTVKFTDGNTIWADKMVHPGKISEQPQYIFASLPHTWETYDSRVEEGPWVMKYRDKYYLMYNANHTAPSYGNYALGVAVADGPLAFNHGNKYPYPVVASNQVYLEDHFVDILKYSAKDPGLFSYTCNAPAENWAQTNFSQHSWQQGKAGFGNAVVENSFTRKIGTPWHTENIWLRKNFSLPPGATKNLMMRIHHLGDATVYLNGHIIYEKEDEDYTTWNFDRQAQSHLTKGTNVLAVQSRQTKKTRYLDVALFDMKNQQGDDILYVPGQPSIVRGPNGFEWWLVYFAMKNGQPPGQFIDRVLFFNKELYVDGPTGTNTPGYHPLPAKPTFGDNFDQSNLDLWKIMQGNWTIQNNELTQTDATEGSLLINSTPATHYLFEAGVKINNQAAGETGVYAFYKDENNWLKVGLDQKIKSWVYHLNEQGKRTSESHPLSQDFNFIAFHTITIFKNDQQFSLTIDQLPAPGINTIQTNFTEKGIPGLYTHSGTSSFDGILYTIGWDEFDDHITGWKTPETETNGNWSVTKEGLAQNNTSGVNEIFKGDTLEQYDFSAQVTLENIQGNGKAGLYPAYVNADNYLKVVIDTEQKAVVISGKKNGKDLPSQPVLPQNRIPYFADMRYTDFIEKHFTFKATAIVDGIEFYKSPHFMKDTVIENIHEHVQISYRNKDQWHTLGGLQVDTTSHPAFEKITFDPVLTKELRMVNKVGENYIYKIFVQENLKSSFHIRASRHADEIVISVDGKEMVRIENQWPAAKVGLITQDMKANFNGIMLYHLP